MNRNTSAAHPPLSVDDAFTQACIAFSRPRRIAASEAEQALLRQATQSHHPHEGKDIAIWTLGRGPRVLLVHGWDSRGSHLAGFVEPLLRAGFSLTLFDMPAHGDSDGEHGSVVLVLFALERLNRTERPHGYAPARMVVTSASTSA